MESSFVLSGRWVDLVPLAMEHAESLTEASAQDPSLYQWTPVPKGREAAETYIATALSWRDEGTAVPFAIRRKQDGVIVGSTRYWNIERWDWPSGHLRHEKHVDVCEIGYTFLAASAVRTAVNTEAKFLMLQHAFEVWGTLRVSLLTDSRNARSRAAIERIGGLYEGILRAHKLAVDGSVRDSARYSIVTAEWPSVKERLLQRMQA